MVTLLGSLLGFFGSFMPDCLKFFNDKHDRAHELAVLKMQVQQQKQGHIERLDEISAKADAEEVTAIYKTYTTNIHWVDALNGTVRPVLAYSFFLLYVGVKISQLGFTGEIIWTEEDNAIFAAIISFYFGQRAMRKIRG